MPVLNAQTVGNAYPTTPGVGASLAQVWNSKGGWFSVTNAGAFVKLQYGELGAEHWTDEILLGAGAFVVLPPNCIGMQFRNSVANAISTVTAQIAQGDEPPLAISSIGQTNVVSVASLNFQHGGVAVATEPTLNLIDVGGQIGWTVADNVAQTRVDVTPVVSSAFIFPGSDGTGAASAAIGAAAGTLQVAAGTTSAAVAAAATNVFTSTVTGDVTGFRYTVAGDGTVKWGPGNAATDVTLARTAAGTMTWTLGQLNITTNAANSGIVMTTSGAGNALRIFTSGDTTTRLTIDFAGAHLWGPGGAAATDVSLSRSGVGTLAMGGLVGAAQTRNRLELWLASKSLIALGETVAANANPQLTFYRTAAGAESGPSMRWEMPSSLRGMVLQAGSSAAYGSETYTTLVEFNQAGSMLWGPEGAQDVTLARLTTGILQLNPATLYQAQNLINGAVTVPATITPDLKLGPVQRAGVTAGGANTLTIAAPLSPPNVNNTCLLVIRISNTGGGIVTLAWNAAYVAGATLALPASIANNANMMAMFVWNSAAWQIVAIS